MSKQWMFVAAIALNTVLSPYALAAQSDSPSPVPNNQVSEMPKDAWLKAMEPILPGMICKGFMRDPALKTRFDDLKISYDQCVSMIPESVKKCNDKLYSNIPEIINAESAGVWGKSLGECIGKDFAEHNLLPASH